MTIVKSLVPVGFISAICKVFYNCKRYQNTIHKGTIKCFAIGKLILAIAIFIMPFDFFCHSLKMLCTEIPSSNDYCPRTGKK